MFSSMKMQGAYFNAHENVVILLTLEHYHVVLKLVKTLMLIDQQRQSDKIFT